MSIELRKQWSEESGIDIKNNWSWIISEQQNSGSQKTFGQVIKNLADLRKLILKETCTSVLLAAAFTIAKT